MDWNAPGEIGVSVAVVVVVVVGCGCSCVWDTGIHQERFMFAMSKRSLVGVVGAGVTRASEVVRSGSGSGE